MEAIRQLNDPEDDVPGVTLCLIDSSAHSLSLTHRSFITMFLKTVSTHRHCLFANLTKVL